MTDDLEQLLRATLAEDGAAYPVSVGALGQLQERLAGTPQSSRRTSGPARRRRTRLALAGAGAGLIAVAAAVGVLVSVLTPAARSGPAVSLATGRPPVINAPAPTPPPSFTGTKLLALEFTATRLLLGGDDVYAFGADSAGHPWVARVHDGVVVTQAKLPAPVCSASLDGTGSIAVVVQHGPGATDCSGRSGRGSLELLDATRLSTLAPSVPARGGDALVRPEGTYAVDGGVISLLDAHTLAPTGVSYRLGSTRAVVNLAGDPGQDVLFATVYDPGRPTRLFALKRHTLRPTRRGVDLAANQGALPYATADGGVWVSLAEVATGHGGDGQQVSAAELHPATGPVSAYAFEGSPLLANFAESGSRLWALDVDGTLRCASLRTGDLDAASSAPAPGIIAADRNHVYVAPAAHRLDILTPSAACGG